MVSKLKAGAEDKRNGDKKKNNNTELQSTHVVVTRHERVSSSMQSERSTTELPERVITYAQCYKYKFICEVVKKSKDATGHKYFLSPPPLHT